MGQYYYCVILGEAPKDGDKEIIRTWLCAYNYHEGVKLMEHSYHSSKMVQAAEYLLSPYGMFYKSPVVWAGDYADEEPQEDMGNLYHCICDKDKYPENDSKGWITAAPHSFNTEEYPYIVNHTKKVYMNKYMQEETEYESDDDGVVNGVVNRTSRIHPLPILTSEGNGAGGGDYRGKNEIEAGSWARDVISVEKEPPPSYQEVNILFRED